MKNEHEWWLANRDYKELFSTELEEAIKLLRALPGAGAVYHRTPVPGLRRIYVGALGCHMYYTFDAAALIVRAFWPARRGRGPRLR